MRILGIDYGVKRIGLAISDESNHFAFPHSVVANDDQAMATIVAVCRAEGVGQIVLGESLDYGRRDNPLMRNIYPFKEELEKVASLPVIFEPEDLSSKEAEQIIGKDKLLDARAAAIILRTYLDRQFHDQSA